MNSKEMYDMFDKQTNKQLQMLISMAIIYLEKDRLMDFKDIMKDIKGCRKHVNKKESGLKRLFKRLFKRK